MPKRGRTWFRCRDCQHEFGKPYTPTKASVVTCPKCGSDEIEVM